jgi:hypothetical protein
MTATHNSAGKCIRSPPLGSTGTKVHCTQTRLMADFNRCPTSAYPSCNSNDCWRYYTSLNMKLKVILESDVKQTFKCRTYLCGLPIFRKYTRGNDLKPKNRVQISPVRVWNDAHVRKQSSIILHVSIQCKQSNNAFVSHSLHSPTIYVRAWDTDSIAKQTNKKQWTRGFSYGLCDVPITFQTSLKL